MGLVPWVLREQAITPVADSVIAKQFVDAIPEEMTTLQEWLPHQHLSSFVSAGKLRQVMGPEDAALLVVVDTDSAIEQQPLDGEAARLFDLMMRAINLTRHQLRLCRLAPVSTTTTPNADNAQSLSDVCNGQTKAVLLLLQNWNALAHVAQSELHEGRLGTVHLPFWRIPHPDVLLRQSTLKRQAWSSLQALQRAL